MRRSTAFAVATAASAVIFARGVRRAVLAGRRRSGLADRARRVGQDHQLADGADRGGQSDQRRSAACSSRSTSTRCSTSPGIIGIAIIAISLPLLWWRFRHDDREALIGIALVMVVVVLFVPAALPWYYTWPLAVMSALAQSRAGDRRDRGLLDVDHGDLQTRRRRTACTRGCTWCWRRHAPRPRGIRCTGLGPRRRGQYAIAWARRTTSRA